MICVECREMWLELNVLTSVESATAKSQYAQMLRNADAREYI